MKNRNRQRPELEEKANGVCCWAGCFENGVHPAPKSRNTKDRYHFCLAHVRLYNKSWNFFNGMSDDEAEAFYVDSITGHRPTRKMGVNSRHYHRADEIKEQVFREFNFSSTAQSKRKEVPDNEKKALDVLGLKAPVTMKQIKTTYKELAKRYHPDVNGHKDEDKLKIINQAYSLLKNSGFFK